MKIKLAIIIFILIMIFTSSAIAATVTSTTGLFQIINDLGYANYSDGITSGNYNAVYLDIQSWQVYGINETDSNYNYYVIFVRGNVQAAGAGWYIDGAGLSDPNGPSMRVDIDVWDSWSEFIDWWPKTNTNVSGPTVNYNFPIPNTTNTDFGWTQTIPSSWQVNRYFADSSTVGWESAINTGLQDNGPYVWGFAVVVKVPQGVGYFSFHVTVWGHFYYASIFPSYETVRFPSSGGYLATFIIDNVPPSAPTVNGTSPTKDNTPTWTWDTPSGAVEFRYQLDSGGWVPTGNNFYTPTTALSDGNHTLNVQAKDSAGNWSISGSKTILVDTTPPSAPTVSGTSPTKDNTPTWTWDTPSGTVGFQYQLNGGGWVPTGNNFYTPTTVLSDGNHTLNVQAKDSVGNWSISGPKTILVDTTPPSGNLSINNNDIETNYLLVTLAITGTDSLSGIKSMCFSNDNATWSSDENFASSKNWNLSTYGGNENEGIHTVYLKLIDNANNSFITSDDISYTAVPSAPEITNISCLQRKDGTGIVDITYTGTDANNDTCTYSVYEYSTDNTNWYPLTRIDSGSEQFTASGASLSVVWNVAVDLPNTEDSTIWVRLQVNDGTYDSNLAISQSFEIDIKPPTNINNTSPSNGAFGVSINTSVQSALGNDAHAISYYFQLDTANTFNTANLIESGWLSSNIWSLPALINGTTYYWRVKAKDSWENETSSYSNGWSFRTNYKPTITMSSGNQRIDGSKIVDINYTGTDLDDDLCSYINYEYSLDSTDGSNGTWSTMTRNDSGQEQFDDLGANLSFEWKAGSDANDIEDSQIWSRLQASDGKDTSNLDSVSFVLDTKGPLNVSPSSPSNGAIDISVNPNLSCTSGDDTHGPIEYYFQLDTTPTFSSGGLEKSGWIFTTTWTPPVNLMYSTTYYWRVKGRDGWKNESSYSSIYQFSTPSGPPVISYMVVSQRKDGSGIVDINYKGTDSENDNCNYINYEYSRDNNIWYQMTRVDTGSEAFSINGTSLSFIWNAKSDLPNIEDTSVWVRLQVSDGSSNSNLCESSQFLLDTKAPINITPNSPVDQTGISTNTVLNASAQDSSSLQFYFQLDTTNTFNSTDLVESNWLNNNSWNPSALKLGTTYYWRVKVKDEFGNTSDYSQTAKFTTTYHVFNNPPSILSISIDPNTLFSGEAVVVPD